MKKDTRPRNGARQSNVSASATEAAARSQQRQPTSSEERRADAAVSSSNAAFAATISARYIDSRMKQFCLR